MKKINLLILGLLVSVTIMGETVTGNIKKQNQKISIPGALNTSSANPLAKGKLNLTVKTQIFDNDKVVSGTNEVPNLENKNTEVFNNTISLRYGLSDKISLKTNIPIVNKEMHLTKSGASETTLESSGIGDIKAFIGYNLKSQNKRDKYSALIELGFSLPTGETDKLFSINTKKGVNNSTSPLGLQLGDGSLDTIAQLTLSKTINKSRIDFSTSYTFNTEGDNNLENGDEISLDFAYVNRTTPKIALQAELNGQYSYKNKVNGIEEESGGTIVYATPGINVKVTDKLNLISGIQIPIYKNLNGEQLISDYKIVSKIVYNIK